MVRSDHLFVVFALVERKNDKRGNDKYRSAEGQTANCVSPNLYQHRFDSMHDLLEGAALPPLTNPFRVELTGILVASQLHQKSTVLSKN